LKNTETYSQLFTPYTNTMHNGKQTHKESFSLHLLVLPPHQKQRFGAEERRKRIGNYTAEETSDE
jgi:hypothetical protein